MSFTQSHTLEMDFNDSQNSSFIDDSDEDDDDKSEQVLKSNSY